MSGDSCLQFSLAQMSNNNTTYKMTSISYLIWYSQSTNFLVGAVGLNHPFLTPSNLTLLDFIS